jgi:hypothetical protein
MRIVMSKVRQILYLTAICLVMLAVIAPMNAPTSKTVYARKQQLASVKTGALVDMEMMLSRIFPFYKADSWLNMGRNGLDARNSLLKPGLSNKLIVPVQDPGKTSVPFKGWITKEGIAKEGTVSLVLKIYDQSNGGTKLYEATHEVEVTHGQYFAMIQVPSEALANSQAVWLEAASVEEKELAFEPRQQFATKPLGGVGTQTVNSALLCYTCSPNAFMRGAIPVPSGNPTEYGAGCLGDLTIRTDYRPYFCTN